MPIKPAFDEAIHAPTRLRLCAMLRPLGSADFGALAETLAVSDANLSKTIRTLTDLGYLALSKRPSPERGDARRVTSVSLTPRGRAALDGHLAALRELAALAQSAGD